MGGAAPVPRVQHKPQTCCRAPVYSDATPAALSFDADAASLVFGTRLHLPRNPVTAATATLTPTTKSWDTARVCVLLERRACVSQQPGLGTQERAATDKGQQPLSPRQAALAHTHPEEACHVAGARRADEEHAAHGWR